MSKSRELATLVQRLRRRARHAKNECRFGDAEDFLEAAGKIELLQAEIALVKCFGGFTEIDLGSK